MSPRRTALGIGANALKKLGLKLVSLNGSNETSWITNLPELSSNLIQAFGLPEPADVNLPITFLISPWSADESGTSTSPKK